MINKITATSLLIGVLIGVGIVFLKNDNQIDKNNKSSQLNKDNCLSEDCLIVDDLEYPASQLPADVEQALYEAIQDEYKARTLYEVTIDKFGAVRPFSMIVRAEEQHISSLKSIYDKYGLDIPDPENISLSMPDKLSEVCQIGVDAEIANVNLYKNELLSKVYEYPDITSVFNNLMNASQEKHLPAFERCAK